MLILFYLEKFTWKSSEWALIGGGVLKGASMVYDNDLMRAILVRTLKQYSKLSCHARYIIHREIHRDECLKIL